MQMAKVAKVDTSKNQAEASGEVAPVLAGDTRAILMTGATHARELLSAQVPLFLCLKLIHQGMFLNKDKY